MATDTIFTFRGTSLAVRKVLKRHLIQGRVRIRDVCSGPRFLSIPDPTAATEEKGEKFVVLPFSVAKNMTK
jgi:hypothetical protein